MAFVKFSRGLISQYNNLAQKDSDTLYLVYENANSETGLLYLGNKLISSVGTDSINLSNLTDISMPAELEDGMLLQYVGTTHKWEARPLEDVLSDYEGTGSSSSIPVVDSLDNISNPHENDIAIAGTELFIYDGSEWQSLTVSDLEDRVSNLETKVGVEANEPSGQVATGLYKKLEDLRSDLQTEITNSIANAQHLRYQVVNEISEIDLTNEEATQNTVFLIPKSVEDAQADDGYNEYLVNNGVLEKIGSWDADLTNYVTKDDTSLLLTEQQQQKLNSIGLDENNRATIQAIQVGGLDEAIQNAQFIKSVDVGTFNVTDEGQLQLISVPSIDLSGYVQTSLYRAEVGNLSDLQDRVSDDSTLVEEINNIKQSIIWKDLKNN